MKRLRSLIGPSPWDVYSQAMDAPPMTEEEIQQYNQARADEMARAEAKRNQAQHDIFGADCGTHPHDQT